MAHGKSKSSPGPIIHKWLWINCLSEGFWYNDTLKQP